jgi:hypothetical protein
MPTNGQIPESIFEPTSIAAPPVVNNPVVPIYRPLEQATCPFPDCAGDPKIAGRLDEVSFLLERCRHTPSTLDPEWPWRTANSSAL